MRPASPSASKRLRLRRTCRQLILSNFAASSCVSFPSFNCEITFSLSRSFAAISNSTGPPGRRALLLCWDRTLPLCCGRPAARGGAARDGGAAALGRRLAAGESPPLIGAGARPLQGRSHGYVAEGVNLPLQEAAPP